MVLHACGMVGAKEDLRLKSHRRAQERLNECMGHQGINDVHALALDLFDRFGEQDLSQGIASKLNDTINEITIPTRFLDDSIGINSREEVYLSLSIADQKAPEVITVGRHLFDVHRLFDTHAVLLMGFAPIMGLLCLVKKGRGHTGQGKSPGPWINPYLMAGMFAKSSASSMVPVSVISNVFVLTLNCAP